MTRKSIYKRLPKNGKRGQTNLTPYTGKKGVYKIYENTKLVYVGSSTTNLYKTILRHFQKWNDTKQIRRISYKNRIGKRSYTFRVELMPKASDKEIELKEYRLIKRYKPRDNKVDLCNTSDKINCNKLKKAKSILKKKKPKKKSKLKNQEAWRSIRSEDLPF